MPVQSQAPVEIGFGRTTHHLGQKNSGNPQEVEPAQIYVGDFRLEALA